MTIAPIPKSAGRSARTVDQGAERTPEERGDPHASLHDGPFYDGPVHDGYLDGGSMQDCAHDDGNTNVEQPGLRLPIDWQALRGRLFAARQQQAAIDPQSSPESLRLRLRGSFDGCAASVLTTYHTVSKSINLDASSYGKPAEGMDSPVADVTKTGGRGQR